MHRLIAAAVLAMSSSVFAGPVAVFKGDGVVIHAYLEDCDIPQLKQILAQYGPAKKAVVQIPGREIRACYTVKDDDVLIVDEEGQGGAIPAVMFKESKGA